MKSWTARVNLLSHKELLIELWMHRVGNRQCSKGCESESHSVMSDSLQPHGQSMEFSSPGYWSGKPFPSPGYLPNPGIEPRSSTLQEDSLPAEPQGKPKNTGIGSLSLLQGIFLTQGSNPGLHCRWILYQLSYQGNPRAIALVYRMNAGMKVEA